MLPHARDEIKALAQHSSVIEMDAVQGWNVQEWKLTNEDVDRAVAAYQALLSVELDDELDQLLADMGVDRLGPPATKDQHAKVARADAIVLVDLQENLEDDGVSRPVENGARAFGRSKDNRGDLPQVSAGGLIQASVGSWPHLGSPEPVLTVRCFGAKTGALEHRPPAIGAAKLQPLPLKVMDTPCQLSPDRAADPTVAEARSVKRQAVGSLDRALGALHLGPSCLQIGLTVLPRGGQPCRTV